MLCKPSFSAGLIKERYEITGPLILHGNENVYRAIDRRALRFARDPYVSAIVAAPSFADDTKGIGTALEKGREWQVLRHPNLLHALELHREQGRLILMTDELTGDEQTTTTSRIVEFLNAVARALAHAHRYGRVHGSLTRACFGLGRNTIPKLFDPCVGSFLSGLAPGMVNGALGASNPIVCYASPEVLREESYDERADVFSMACVAYEMLTGVHPFHGRSSIEAQTANDSIEKLPPLSRYQWRGLRNALAFVVTRRTPTVNEFLEDFNRTTSPVSTRVPAAVTAGSLVALTLIVSDPWRTHNTSQDVLLDELTATSQSSESHSLTAGSTKTSSKSNPETEELEPSPVPQAHVRVEPPTESLRDGSINVTTANEVSATRTDSSVVQLLTQANDQMTAGNWLGKDNSAAETFALALESERSVRRPEVARLERHNLPLERSCPPGGAPSCRADAIFCTRL